MILIMVKNRTAHDNCVFEKSKIFMNLVQRNKTYYTTTPYYTHTHVVFMHVSDNGVLIIVAKLIVRPPVWSMVFIFC